MIGESVDGNPAATVITSSPGNNLLSPNLGEVKVVTASKFEEDPELVNNIFSTP